MVTLCGRALIISILLAVAMLIASTQDATALSDVHAVAVLSSGADETDAFCVDFNLTPAQAFRALRNSRLIAGDVFLHAYEWLPCFVRGTARIAGVNVRWELRAGGNGILLFDDGNKRFIGCALCRRNFGMMRK